MKLTRHALVLGFALILSARHVGAQTMTTITSTILQSGFNGAIGAGESAPIAASAFTFSGQPMLASIASVSITLTVIDGDTGLGPNGVVDTPYPPPGSGQYGDDDFDVNSWTLHLNNIDLGSNLLLNGFNSYDSSVPLAQSDFITRTITGMPANADVLLTALNSGSLTATIYDSTGVSMSNGFEVPATQLDRSTPAYATLSITGTTVPEPDTSRLLGLAVIPLLAGLALRRKARLVAL